MGKLYKCSYRARETVPCVKCVPRKHEDCRSSPCSTGKVRSATRLKTDSWGGRGRKIPALADQPLREVNEIPSQKICRDTKAHCRFLSQVHTHISAHALVYEHMHTHRKLKIKKLSELLYLRP